MDLVKFSSMLMCLLKCINMTAIELSRLCLRCYYAFMLEKRR